MGASATLLAPFERDVLMATGRAIRVRAATGADVELLRRFYGDLGDTSTYSRWFGIRPFVSTGELTAVTVQDPRRHVALLAEADGELIGVGEYHARRGADEAEVSFAVADRHQHQGVATVLLEDLAVIARATGFRRLAAQTMYGNKAMLAVFRAAGLVYRSWHEDGTVRVQLDLTGADLFQDRAELRDWAASVRSLEPILHPGHVVVIGVDPDMQGRSILAKLQANFDGDISVIHPSGRSIAGIDSARSVDELAAVPDLAIIAVPAPAVLGVVDECGRAGVPAVVITSDGFAERDAAGARRQEHVLAAARRHGMRVVGPNSLGVVSTRCGLDATSTDQTFPTGGIAVAAQSGGVGIAVAAEAARRNAGLSSLVSMGNKIDVSGNDLLRRWADDDDTTVVVLYLESFGDPVRFARVARAVSQRKPIVALLGGRTAPGRRGTKSHTAAVATDEAAVAALFAHTGVMQANTLEELVDVAVLLDRQPAPRGHRVALVGNAGGPLILGADAAATAGLDVVELSARLQAEITRVVPSAASATNPVDLGGGVAPDPLAAVVQAVGSSGEVDACIVVTVDDARSGAVDRALEDVEVDIPLAVAMVGRRDGGAALATPERAARAMAIAARRATWLANVAAEQDDHSGDVDDPAALMAARRFVRHHVRLAVAEATGSADRHERWLTPAVGSRLLAAIGVPVGAGGADDPGGRELQIAIVRPVGSGPLVVVGDGGAEAELRDDQVVLVAPVTRAAARRAIEGLRIAPLFRGFRGRPPLAADAVVELVHRIGLLAAAVPEIVELVLDPVVVDAAGCVVVDVRVAVSDTLAAPVPLRGLRGHRTG